MLQSDATECVAEATDLDETLKRLEDYGNPSLHVLPDHSLSILSTPVPRPSDTEVLIHVRRTGICGSDIHFWRHGQIGSIVVDRPSILGHEPAGVVLAVGSSVRHLKVGDRISIEPGVPCNSCHHCTDGKYNLCSHVKFSGCCPYAGSIRRFMTHDARFCHRIPENMSFEQAALLEPLSVGLRAISQCEGSIQIGRPVLVCGAGPIGLISLMAAKACGAWPLVITDVDVSRLRFARNLIPGVATYQIDTATQKDPQNISQELRALFQQINAVTTGSEPDFYAPDTVLECTGVTTSIITAAYTVGSGGTVMVVGLGSPKIDGMPFLHLAHSEIKVKFTHRYANTWPNAINAIAGDQSIGIIEKLVTATYPLEEAIEAFELLERRNNDAEENAVVVKVMIADDTDIKL